jgi:hypothetical protein
MRWTYIENKTKTYRVLTGKPGGNGNAKNTRRRMVDNSKIDLREKNGLL